MKQILLFLSFFLFSFLSYAQPANDICANAQTVTPDGSCVSGTNVSAVDNWNNVVGCQSGNNNSNHPDVWYSFTATGSVAEFNVTAPLVGGIGGNIEIILVSGLCTGTMTLYGSLCSASPLSGSISGLTAGTVYYYTVSNRVTATTPTGAFNACVKTVNPPPNDICTTAQAVTPDGTCVNGTLINAADDWGGQAGCQTSTLNRDVWYSFTATGSQFTNTITAGTLSGTIELTLFSGTCAGGFTLVGSACGASPLNVTINGLQTGTQYFYLISTPATSTPGTFTTCPKTTSPPVISGQDCSNSAILCDKSTFTQGSSTAGYGVQEVSTSNSCWGAGGERQSKWFKFSVACSGTLEFNIKPNNTADDYDWAIWDITTKGCPTTANTTHKPIACNWSGCTGSTGLSSCTASEPSTKKCGVPTATYQAWVNTTAGNSNPITVTAGNTYTLLVDNFSATNNGYVLTFGGACAGGTAVMGPEATFAASVTSCLTVTATKPTCAPSTFTYKWEWGDGITTTGLPPQSHTYVNGGTYSVALTVTDPLGCSKTSSVTLVVPPMPDTPFAADTTICAGNTATLTATYPGGSYQWYSAATGGTLLASSATYTTPVLTSSATYYVQTTVGGCTSPRYPVNVTVTPFPLAPAAVHGERCGPGTVNLSVTGTCTGGTIKWYADSTTTTVLTTGSTYTTPVLSATTSYFVACDAGGCLSPRTKVTATINPPPAFLTVSATPAIICKGGSSSLSATASGGTGSLTFGWSPGSLSGSPVTVTPSATTNYTVTVTDTKGCTATSVVPVTVNDSITGFASASPLSFCSGLSTTLNANAGGGTGVFSYSWTSSPAGFTSSAASATVSPTVNTTYTVTVTSGACSKTSSVSVTVNPLPAAPGAGNGQRCGTGTVSISATGCTGTIKWYDAATGGILVGTGTPFTTPSISATTTYYASCTSAAGCEGPRTAVTATINPIPAAPAPVNAQRCGTGTLSISATGCTGTIKWYDAAAGGSQIGSGTPFTTPSISSTTTYYASCTSASGCEGPRTAVTATIVTPPTASISGSASICSGACANLTFSLTGSGPFNVVYSDGSSTFNLSGISTGHTVSVCPTSSKTYTLVSVTDNSTPACTGTVSGSATITVNSPITVSTQTETCNVTETAYTVTFTISGGNSATYTVAPAGSGTLSGSTFTSNLINNATGYSFTVTDANNCNPLTVAGSKTCACITYSGTMNTTPLSICENQSATAIHNGNHTFDGNDVMQFILHSTSGSTLGTIYATSNTPTFSFTGALTYGVTYYISAIVGNNNGSGGVNLSDPCLSISPGTPVVFIKLPTAVLSGTTAICSGASANLTFTLTGNGPFNVVYSNGSTSFNLNNINSGHTVAVTPTVNTTYTLVSVTNNTAPFCNGSVSGTAVITVNNAPTAGSLTETCNATNTSYIVSFTITGGNSASYTVSPAGSGTLSGNTFTSNPIASGSTYSFTVNDVNNCNPVIVAGSKTCSCTSFAGTMNTTPLSVCENQPAVATHNGNHFLDGDDARIFVLHSGSGTSLGTIFATSSTPSFSFSSPLLSYGTVYYISAVVGNNNGSGGVNYADPCLSVSSGTPVIFNPLPAAAITGTATVCSGTPVNLSFTLTGNGPFNVVYNNGTSNITLNNINTGHTITLTPTATTTYSLVSVTDNSSPACNGTVSGPVTVTVNNRPAATVTGGGTICNNGSVATINFALTGQAPWNITYNDGNGNSSNITTSSSPYTFTTATAGTYTITGITDATGCAGTASGNAVVIVNQLPIVSATDKNMCVGDNISLCETGGQATSWSWSPATGLSATNVQCPNASPASTQTYTVTGMNSGGCTNSATVTVTVVAKPVLAFNPPNPEICFNEQIQIDVTGADSYTWSPSTGISFNNATGSSVTASPSTNTTYTVVGSLASGCNSTSTITVTVNPLPNPGIVLSKTTICQGENITLTGSGAVTGSYAWTGSPAGHGLTSSSGSSVSASPITSGLFTYNVVVTDVKGCSNSTTANLQVNALPSPSIFFDKNPICLGETVVISSGAGTGSYAWTGTALSSSSGNPVTAKPATSGVFNYSVLFTDANNCSASVNDNLLVNALPVVNITPSAATICFGNSTSLTASVASGTGTYVWSGGEVTALITVMPSDTTTYTVTGKDANGCTNTASATVNVNPLPIVTIAVPSICLGNVSNMTANGALNYTWSPATFLNTTTGSAVDATPNAAGSYAYTVTGTDANGCANSASDDLIVNALPVFTASASPNPICIGKQAILSGSDPALTYVYTEKVSGDTVSSTVFPALTLDYTLTGTDNSTGCVSTADVTVVVRPALSVTASNDAAICEGDFATLTATVSGGMRNYYYSWTPALVTVQDSVTKTNGLTTTTTFTVTVNDDCGSTPASAQVKVTVNPLPIVDIDADDGCAPHTATFTNASSAGAYSWNFGNGATSSLATPVSLYNNAGNYTVTLTVTDANGCVNSGTTPVAVYQAPKAKITSDPLESATILNPSFDFNSELSTGNIISWNWNFDSLGISNKQNPSFSFPDTGSYDVTLIVNTQNCADTTTYRVYVIGEFTVYIPNTFTPNGDNLNDYFAPLGEGVSTEGGDFEMLIFNRWGQLVYQTKDVTKPWNGAMNNSGDIMQIDTYVYKIMVTDKYTRKKHYFTAHFNLMK